LFWTTPSTVLVESIIFCTKHTDKEIEFGILEGLSESLRKGPELLLVSGPSGPIMSLEKNTKHKN
jgi:hypothetical protein